MEAVLDVLAPVTGDQPVHCGMWDGWGCWYSRGEDPRAPGMAAINVVWAETAEPSQEEIDRLRADARERPAADYVQRPDAAPLALPERSTTCGPAR